MVDSIWQPSSFNCDQLIRDLRRQDLFKSHPRPYTSGSFLNKQSNDSVCAAINSWVCSEIRRFSSFFFNLVCVCLISITLL